MEDKDIIDLYFKRDERAISETEKKYDKYCRVISERILGISEDVEECLNDTWLKTWNSIPPKKPNNLSTYLAKIVRNVSFDSYRYKRALKRNSELEVILDELEDIVSGENNQNTIDEELEIKEMIGAVNEYLKEISKEKRSIFILRYWFGMSIKEISEKVNLRENNVSVILNRVRKDLKVYLKERGFEL